LAFDVYFAKSGGAESFEKRRSLSNLYSTSVVDDTLRTVRLEKFTTRVIAFEAKLVSEETECDVSIAACLLAPSI
jgi:hypothetical protein